MKKCKKREFLTRKEAAEYLGVKHNTLSIWAFRRKNLPYYKVGKMTQYKLSDLDNFIEGVKQDVDATFS